MFRRSIAGLRGNEESAITDDTGTAIHQMTGRDMRDNDI